MALKICTLASGSKGNCIYITDEKTSVIIDAGSNFHTLNKRAESQNIDLKNIDAIFSTHCHTDHCSAIKRIADSVKVPVYVHSQGLRALSDKTNLDIVRFTTFEKEFSIGSLNIRPLSLSHDVPHCSGFVVNSGESTAGVVMDLGEIDNNIIDALKGSNTVIIESNHDEHMLETGRYPYHLKRRISSSLGHLSNATCAESCLKLVASGTKNILLAHLSEENNLPELAYETLAQRLLLEGLIEGKDYFAEVALQYKISKMIVG